MKLNERPFQERTDPHLHNLHNLLRPGQITQGIRSFLYPETCKNEEGQALFGLKALIFSYFQ